MSHSVSLPRAYSRYRVIALTVLAGLTYPQMASAGWAWYFNFFQGSNLQSSNHQGTDMHGVNFQNTNLSRANFQKANVARANFKNANMQEANFQNAIMSGSNFQGANMTRVNLEGVQLDGANLQEAKMAFTNLVSANMKAANLEGADVKQANFQNADLTSANLKNADLFQSSLNGAKITSTNFQGANLQYSGLQDIDMEGINLQGVDVQESNFAGSFIHPAGTAASFVPFGCIRVEGQRPASRPTPNDDKWYKAANKAMRLEIPKDPNEACTNFEDASLEHAIFHNVNFSNEDHFHKSRLTVNQLCQAQSLYGSVFPASVMAEIKKNVACAQKLTDKLLFEQVRDDFTKSRKTRLASSN